MFKNEVYGLVLIHKAFDCVDFFDGNFFLNMNFFSPNLHES